MSRSKEKIILAREVEQAGNALYYNANLVNNNPTNIQAQFRETLGANILPEKPEKYFMAIARMSLDGGQIPLLYYPTNTYYVSLSYEGISSDPIALIPPPGGPADPNFGVACYDYQTFLNTINDGYTSALVNLKAKPGNAVPMGAVSPYFLVDKNSGIISFYSQSAYYDQKLANYIKIFCNWTLYDYFNNFEIQFFGENLASKQDIRWQVYNEYGTNIAVSDGGLNPSVPAGYTQMQGTGANLTRFFEPQLIRFRTAEMGVQAEYIQNPNLTGNINQQSSDQIGIPNSLILCDFIPSFNSSEIIGWRQSLVYNPNFYRLIDLLTDSSNRINISIWWVNQAGQEFPFEIGPGRSCTCKLAFLRKSLYLNY